MHEGCSELPRSVDRGEFLRELGHIGALAIATVAAIWEY
jgi:hypothetical protein